MGSVQIHNAERDALQIPDRQAYEHYHEPLGDFGIFNGQLEQGLAGRYANDLAQGIEGWTLEPFAGGTIDRVTGGLAGNWRLRGGQAGMGQGGLAISWKYIPVDEDRDYYASAAFIANDAAATVFLQAFCYTAAKVFIAAANIVNNATPGTSWVRYQRNIGPNGDVAWPANTRYVRIRVVLQFNGALTGAFAYVDDVQFQQLKKTYSPLIRLVSDRISSDATRTFNAGAALLWAGSPITLTLEELGYIWYEYNGVVWGDTINVMAWDIEVFIDGVSDNLIVGGVPVVSNRTPFSMNQRSTLSYAAGPHTLDVRVTDNVGIVQGALIRGSAFYVRVN
ncbi:hypothetical protein LCGC14_0520190 [marine sediment metagenome]|uniref:Uncharacterized protein n=1 Tax=marine sediment metagenome TaxID=412755 RepID=A0A0F9UK23_9ZZZZ